MVVFQQFILLLINCLIDAALLFFGEELKIFVFLLPLANIATISLLSKKRQACERAIFATVLMLMLSTIQILYSYSFLDAGGIALMVAFTAAGTILPLAIFSTVLLIKYLFVEKCKNSYYRLLCCFVCFLNLTLIAIIAFVVLGAIVNLFFLQQVS